MSRKQKTIREKIATQEGIMQRAQKEIVKLENEWQKNNDDISDKENPNNPKQA